MKEFLAEYWDDIVEFIDKIYFAIKNYILGLEDAE